MALTIHIHDRTIGGQVDPLLGTVFVPYAFDNHAGYTLQLLISDGTVESAGPYNRRDYCENFESLVHSVYKRGLSVERATTIIDDAWPGYDDESEEDQETPDLLVASCDEQGRTTVLNATRLHAIALDPANDRSHLWDIRRVEE